MAMTAIRFFLALLPAIAATFTSPTSYKLNSVRRCHNKEKRLSSQAHCYDPEVFSVAPMMGHTNRHYRYYWRLLSEHTYLYTEMVPSAQVVRAYRQARALYLGDDHPQEMIHPEQVREVISRMREDPAKEYSVPSRPEISTLSDLVGLSDSVVEHPVVLQLGGRDPEMLAAASMIGHAVGKYWEINLNCGCPSNAVGGRSGGAVLMKNPSHVAHCVEAMNEALRGTSCNVTVKHRLGVHDASTYCAEADKQKDDTESFESCRSFVKTITLGGAVVKCHVHSRLGLLGEFSQNEESSETTTSSNQQQQLWVPGRTTIHNKGEKINHKREQERAKRRARAATILNRNIPPLRPNVVHQLADEFPNIQFIMNGGIQSLSEVKEIIDNDDSKVVGVMVGRAAINHPCSFAAADTLWKTHRTKPMRRPTRGEVLLDYIAYCDQEEERMSNLLGASSQSIDILRRRLVAVPFHLFVGEDGNDAFQRRVKKLTSRSQLIKASSILSGAASFVPVETLNKCVDDHVPWNDFAVYRGGLRRSSAMQRVVY